MRIQIQAMILLKICMQIALGTLSSKITTIFPRSNRLTLRAQNAAYPIKYLLMNVSHPTFEIKYMVFAALDVVPSNFRLVVTRLPLWYISYTDIGKLVILENAWSSRHSRESLVIL